MIAAIATLILIIRLRTASLSNRTKLLAKEVDDRTREIKEHEQLIQHQADHLEELLQIKEKLFTNVSHEFRTPLTLILGPIGRLLEGERDPHRASQLQVIKHNGQRLLRLVDQLLGLSRLSSEEPRTRAAQPLRPLVQSIVSSFQALVDDKKIQLEFMESDDLWVNCAPDALEKILLNLLSNAVKYTPSGGRISVCIKPQGEQLVELTVSDTGIGIPEEHQSSVFDRFHRVDGAGEAIPGAGLGLAVVKELAEAHGGTVDLVSATGKGTIFTVTLPRHHTEVKGAADTNEPVASYAAALEVDALSEPVPVLDRTVNNSVDAKASILIIEDNREMQNYLVSLLSGTYQCLVACDGELGIEAAVDHVPDLVICDVMLPKADGYEVSQRLKTDERTSHVPIVMLTARGDHESRLKGLHERVDDYLTKPFDDKELLLRISNILSIRDVLRRRYSGQLYVNSNSGSQLAEKEQRFLDKLQTVLKRHHTDPDFRIQQMSGEMTMSDRQLQRKLKAVIDHSPVEYLRAYRLKRAVEKLETGMPVGLVADDVGFSSPAYFSSCFKAQFGATPSEYQQGLN